MGQHVTLFLKRVVAIVISTIVVTACGGNKIPQITSEASTGPVATPTPAAGPVVPKNVSINWAASHAKDVAAPGGGYKVWVHLGTAPTTSNSTAVVVPNPGTGTHVTTTTVTLAPGRYYVSVSSYSSNGDSPLSTASLVVVP